MAHGDLTSVAAVQRAYRGAGNTRVELIGEYITRASAAIARWAEREFVGPPDPLQRRYLLEGRTLELAPYDLRPGEALAIVVDPDGVARTLTPPEYRLRPLPVRHGVVERIEIPLAAGGRGVEVAVSGTWGFAELPPDIEEACIHQVAEWLRVSQAITPNTPDLGEPGFAPARALDTKTRWLLAPFRRPVLA